MDLLILLAEYDSFGKEEIDKIWDLQETQHSSVKRTILGCIIEIVPNLSLEVISHIENKLESLEESKFDESTLLFIRKFAQACFKVQGYTKKVRSLKELKLLIKGVKIKIKNEKIKNPLAGLPNI